MYASVHLAKKDINNHYIDVIMTTVASQITSLTVVYSIVYSGRSKKTSKLRVTGLCAGNSPGPVNSRHKGPVTRKMVPFDDVIMYQEVDYQCPKYIQRLVLSVNLLSDLLYFFQV